MKTYNNWLLVTENQIATLYIHNPQKRNAFSEEMAQELDEILTSIHTDPHIRALILTSKSDHFFSSGADMEWFIRMKGPEAERVSEMSHHLFGRLEKLPFPVISVIKGLCLTAGLELILCSDMIYAADNAQFGQIEVRYGITPGGGGTQRLTQLVGPMRARELIYTGKIIDANEAERIGLVNKVYPLASIDDEVGKVIQGILKNSQNAIAECKNLIRYSFTLSKTGFRQEELIFGDRFASGEPKERLLKMKEQMETKK